MEERVVSNDEAPGSKPGFSTFGWGGLKGDLGKRGARPGTDLS